MNNNSNRTFVQDGYQPRQSLNKGYQPTVSPNTPKAAPHPDQKSGVSHKK